MEEEGLPIVRPERGVVYPVITGEAVAEEVDELLLRCSGFCGTEGADSDSFLSSFGGRAGATTGADEGGSDAFRCASAWVGTGPALIVLSSSSSSKRSSSVLVVATSGAPTLSSPTFASAPFETPSSSFARGGEAAAGIAD